MNQNLFRKSSMDQLKSPEQLNAYIRVANPGIWLVIAAIILMLLGVVAWGIFGTMESSVASGALAEDGEVICYISESDAAKVGVGMQAKIGENSGTVESISSLPVQIEGKPSSLYYLCGFSEGDFCYTVKVDVEGLGDGVYPVEITTESVHPITFLIR